MRFESVKVTSAFPAAALFAAILTAVPALASGHNPLEKTVDCDRGKSINDAIASGFRIINVSGICRENVLIRVNGVTLRPDPANPGSIEPAFGVAINVNGATGASVRDLEVTTGSHTAIFVSHGQATFTNVEVSNSGGTDYVLIARSNSTVVWSGGQIGPAENGALSDTSSSLSISGATISGIGTTGAAAANNSFLRVGSSTLDGAGSGLNSNGVSASGGSAVAISGAMVSNFSVAGVVVVGASANISGSTISENGGGANLYPGQGGVVVGAAGSVLIGASSTIEDNTGYGLVLVDSSGGDCAVVAFAGNSLGPVSVSAGSEAAGCP